jgi:hypothetical protein
VDQVPEAGALVVAAFPGPGAAPVFGPLFAIAP